MKNQDAQVDIWLNAPIYKTINKSSAVNNSAEDLSSSEFYKEISQPPDIDINIYKSNNLRYDDSEEYWTKYYQEHKSSINESFKVSNFKEFYNALKCADNIRSKRNSLKDTPLNRKKTNA